MSVTCLDNNTSSTTTTATNPIQCRALTQLKQDTSRVVLTADKGMAMVIMDQQDYNNKANTLLQDTNTYRVLNKDPTNSLKNKLITILKDIKQTGGLSNIKYNYILLVQTPLNSMAFLKSINLALPQAHSVQ